MTGSARIHPSAVVEDGARLGEGVEVGAFAFVGAGVAMGKGTRVHHHATVEGHTSLGEACEVFPYACVGSRTQDLKFRGGTPGLRVGDRNVFRECCTIHAATGDGDFTEVGDDNHFLAYVHIAHDCRVGNHVIMSNNATLAGHVVVEDHAVLGGFAGVHQFCRIGRLAMIGGCSKIIQDVPPYLIADGNPAAIRSFNKVGLERKEFPPETIERIRKAYRLLYREGLNRSQAMERMREEGLASFPDTAVFFEFSENSSRGFVPGV